MKENNERKPELKLFFLGIIIFILVFILITNFFGADISYFTSNLFSISWTNSYDAKSDISEIDLGVSCDAGIKGLAMSLSDYDIVDIAVINEEYAKITAKNREMNQILEVHISAKVDEYKLTEKYLNLKDRENVEVNGIDVKLKSNDDGVVKLVAFKKDDISFSIYAYDSFINRINRREFLNLTGEINDNIDRNK